MVFLIFEINTAKRLNFEEEERSSLRFEGFDEAVHDVVSSLLLVTVSVDCHAVSETSGSAFERVNPVEFLSLVVSSAFGFLNLREHFAVSALVVGFECFWCSDCFFLVYLFGFCVGFMLWDLGYETVACFFFG